ncbi:MAG: hypothetical protein QOD42_3662 [Sphingomonadales bacterium]|jgi:hypothetical protein|nr:hypothetical protein [Sphingomonadales bacterium]
MSAPIVALVLAGLALGGAGGPEGSDLSKQPPLRSAELPLPRDGDIAIREELDAARRAGTLAAYDLFLARHPGHKLARTARRERAAIAARRHR